MSLRNLKVGPLVHEEFMQLVREMAVERKQFVTQNDLVHELITNYRKTHAEGKRGKRAK
jgi:hypothetical protein